MNHSSVPIHNGTPVSAGQDAQVTRIPVELVDIPPAAVDDSYQQNSRWRVVAVSVAGSSHEIRGVPCQDAHKWVILPTGALVAAVADGAGSAALAEVGSSIAVDTATNAIVNYGKIPDASAEDPEWVAFLTGVIGSVRAAIEAEAGRRCVKISQLNTTIILAIVTAEIAVVAQVGDGATIGGDSGDNIVSLTSPQNGEYINEATFVTSANALDVIQVRIWRGKLPYFAMISDGLEMVALKMSTREPYPGFFKPLFRFVANEADDRETKDQIQSLLRSTRVRDRTDDDLTLLVASLIQRG